MSSSSEERRSLPFLPTSFTWPLIIALSACGGGGGGSSARSTVTTSAKQDVRDTVNDVYDDETSTDLMRSIVDRDSPDPDSPPPPPEVNTPPVRQQDNPDRVDPDRAAKNPAIIVGREITYQVSQMTFTDPEGGPITMSLKSDSNLPPGLSFNPVTGLISGTPLGSQDLGPNSKRYIIWIVCTDNKGETAEDRIEFLLLPNRGPEAISQIENITYEFGHESRIVVNFKEHFRDPDGDRLTFSIDQTPVGMKMTSSGKYFYGRPSENFDAVITVTALDTVSGKTLTQSFRLTTAENLADAEPADNESPPREEGGTGSTSARQTQALQTQALQTQALQTQALQTQALQTQALQTQALQTQARAEPIMEDFDVLATDPSPVSSLAEAITPMPDIA